VEQISITNPVAGVYDLELTGTTVPFGPQEYFVVYEFLTSDITVTYPMGGEGLIPGSNDRIHWDAYGNSGSFTLEYTTDNGATWTTIANNVNGDERIYDWNVPNTQSGEVRVRVSRGSDVAESEENFSIMSRPQNIEIVRVCQNVNTIELGWDAVAGATGYDIFMLGQQFMDSIGSSATNQFDVVVPDISQEQWFTVRATGPNGLRSNRQIAINFPGAGNGANCYLSCVSDNDAGISSITEPIANFQACSGNFSSDVVVDLENIGLLTESNIPVFYQVDNNPVVTETYAGNLAPGANQSYTFTTPITFPSSGTYTLKTWTGLAGDLTACNDTVTQTITVGNSLTNFPLEEGFEGAFPSNTFQIINADNELTWSDVNTVGSDGASTTASFVNNFSYNASGEEDIMQFVNFDLSNVQNPANAILTFDVAYREFNSSYSDDMRIDVSSECGVSYTEAYFKGGSNLATGPTSTTNWEPSSAADWRNDTIDLSQYIGGDVIVRFININGYGNNLFIDNVNLEVNSTASLNELNALDLTIMPNPTSDKTTVQFGQPLTEETGLSIVSMDGKIIYQEALAKGTAAHTIDVSRLESAVYTVRVQSSKGIVVRKIVVR
jgi:hypothetical protein